MASKSKGYQDVWASKRRQGLQPSRVREILARNGGKCALSGVQMIFDKKEGTPRKGGPGCHPLYAALDHVDAGNPNGGFQIVCYALNDLKGHLPLECFRALTKTKAWKELMKRWADQARMDPGDREAFKRIIRPNA